MIPDLQTSIPNFLNDFCFLNTPGTPASWDWICCGDIFPFFYLFSIFLTNSISLRLFLVKTKVLQKIYFTDKWPNMSRFLSISAKSMLLSWKSSQVQIKHLGCAWEFLQKFYCVYTAEIDKYLHLLGHICVFKLNLLQNFGSY